MGMTLIALPFDVFFWEAAIPIDQPNNDLRSGLAFVNRLKL